MLHIHARGQRRLDLLEQRQDIERERRTQRTCAHLAVHPLDEHEVQRGEMRRHSVLVVVHKHTQHRSKQAHRRTVPRHGVRLVELVAQRNKQLLVQYVGVHRLKQHLRRREQLRAFMQLRVMHKCRKRVEQNGALQRLPNGRLVHERHEDLVWALLRRTVATAHLHAIAQRLGNVRQGVLVEVSLLRLVCLARAQQPRVQPAVQADVAPQHCANRRIQQQHTVAVRNLAKRLRRERQVHHEKVERVAAHQQRVVTECVHKAAHQHVGAQRIERHAGLCRRRRRHRVHRCVACAVHRHVRIDLGAAQLGHAPRKVVERAQADRLGRNEHEPDVLQKELATHRRGDLVEQAHDTVKELARLFFEARQKREQQRMRHGAQVGVQRHIEAVKDVQQRRTYRRRRVLEKGQQSGRPHGQIAAQAVHADHRENVAVHVERTRVHARRQRGVQALRQTLGDNELVGNRIKLGRALQRLEQARKERDKVGPLAHILKARQGPLNVGLVPLELRVALQR